MVNTETVLTAEEAAELAARELRRDSGAANEDVVPGTPLETPRFWVFHPNSARYFASSLSRDSVGAQVPPIVVSRVDGTVTRPVRAGSRVRPSDLGEGEWFIASPSAPPAVDAADGLQLTDRELTNLDALRRFRLRRGSRDAGDALEATIVAEAPSVIDAGLRRAGLTPGPGGWKVGDAHRVHGWIDPDWATVHLSVAGNGDHASPWTVTGDDIDVAALVEERLADAAWIRFWA
ncbi:hypothetical protein ACFUTX_00210 [Microbacterium sp. NPDC057407]|uniref:hypothetical protein n=1 Tax=Microbacterium sp. NPDC057407 TaxID=3346120 RepID=UPI0036724246